MNKYDSIIIGAGAAGIASAINIQRAGKNAIIIEKSTPGGKLVGIDLIENYPGIKSLSGVDLALKMLEQVKIPMLIESVEKIEQIVDGFKIKTNVNTYETKSVIVASGTNNLTLGLKNEGPFIGRGISFCAACDGALYQNASVLVYGSSRKALEEAIYLANICEKVFVINPKEKYINQELTKRLEENQRVKILYQQGISELLVENNEISGVILNDQTVLNVKALFVYQGYVPQTKFLQPLGVLDNDGYIEVNSHYETKRENLYAFGDCTAVGVKQVASAVGMASIGCSFLLKKI